METSNRGDPASFRLLAGNRKRKRTKKLEVIREREREIRKERSERA